MRNDFQTSDAVRDGWWSRPGALALLVMASTIPLLWPDIPPLTDLLGHMGRYRIQFDGAASPTLRRFFDFEWALIGNLGVDLLVMPLAPLLGFERAVKLIMVAIPALTAAGFLWTAREAHGRVPPTALFTLPLAYGFPFQFGFANFVFSVALAFIALAFWLRLSRLGRTRVRAAAFPVISLVLWVAHVFGWAILCLLAFAAAFSAARDTGRGLVAAGLRAARDCLPLAPPLFLMILWRSGEAGGQTGDWFNLSVKMLYLLKALSDRAMTFDIASVAVIVALLVTAVIGKAFAWSRALGLGAMLLATVYLLLPRVLLGSAYADMRLAPYLLAVALLAVRPATTASPNFVRALAVAAMVFFTMRTAATTVSFAGYHRSFAAELAALDHVPVGARVVALVGKTCGMPWSTARLDHLPAMAIVRRHAFVNDQWTLAGAQLLRVRAPDPRFAGDPSQLVASNGCNHREWRDVDAALRLVPRGAFDYLWLVDPPAYDARLTAGLQRVWSNDRSALFRISPPAAARTPASK
ncbi:MAG TPA: hypothetical protein VEZ48_13735 [Sphingomonadaceae bacterium]|nr:hypothetical protein [Sphingomonadaceae bacterium]